MSDRKHDWAAVEAEGSAALSETLTNLNDQGYTIWEVLSTTPREKHSPITYTVIGVKDRAGQVVEVVVEAVEGGTDSTGGRPA